MFWIWAGFIVFILGLLALDLGVFHRKVHVISVKEALGWSAGWISLGLLFSVAVYFGYQHHWMGLGQSVDGQIVDRLAVDPHTNPHGELDGGDATIKYLTGYVIEKSLSVDNIFVIALIFAGIGVPAIYQHRVLFWGILGALLMRGAMIGVGAQLLDRYDWILYVFAGVLILTAVRMVFSGDEEKTPDPKKNLAVRLVARLLPVTDHFHGEHFLVRAGSEASHEAVIPHDIAQGDKQDVDETPPENDAAVDTASSGRWMMTPLLVALVMVEVTDLIFAVDSIPAIFGITTDPFLVFSSNVFAILGLRSLYFALAGMIRQFRFLKLALAIVLLVVGAKMLAHDSLKAHLGTAYNYYMLGVVLLILALGVAASLVWKPAQPAGETEG